MNATITTNLGRVGGEVAEAFGYLTSPAAIAGEINHYEQLVAAGDTSSATAALLHDWRTIQRTQARLVGVPPQQGALELEVR